jgi:hypothetical protein
MEVQIKKTDRPMFEDHPNDPADYHVCRVGIVLAEVCSSNPNAAEVLERFNKENGIGPGHRWTIRERPVGEKTFPQTCDHFPQSHIHYLFQAI